MFASSIIGENMNRGKNAPDEDDWGRYTGIALGQYYAIDEEELNESRAKSQALSTESHVFM